MLWRPINDQFNLAKFALKKYFQGEEHAIKLAESKLHGITAHSARVTLLYAAVHAGRSTEEIGLQANWKNPGPLVLKYTRNRTSVPAQMVQQLVKDMVDHSHPFEVPLDAVLDDGAETSFDEVQFFVKTHGSRANQDFLFHCSQVGGTSVVACGRLTIEECTETGSVLPDPSLLCKRCALARPDVVSRCFTAVRTPGSSCVSAAFLFLLSCMTLISVMVSCGMICKFSFSRSAFQ